MSEGTPLPNRFVTDIPAVLLGPTRLTPMRPDQALKIIDAMADDLRPHLVVTPNLVQIGQINRHPDLALAISRATLLLPDGWPIAVAAGLKASTGFGRVAGSDLLLSLCRQSSRRLAFVGGRANSAALAAETLSAQLPSMKAVCVEAAPASELAEPGLLEALIARICSSKPEIVFLGMGVPKQEQLALALMTRMDRGVILCLGGAIEYAAGTKRRAPVVLQRLYLEWLWRLLTEPQKMVNRYSRGETALLKLVLLSVYRRVIFTFRKIAAPVSSQGHSQGKNAKTHSSVGND